MTDTCTAKASMEGDGGGHLRCGLPAGHSMAELEHWGHWDPESGAIWNVAIAKNPDGSTKRVAGPVRA